MSDTLKSILPSHIEEAAESVLQRACDADVPLVTAESCTGGLLAAVLTDIEGRSHIVERGFVVYSEEAKCDLLGIERELVDDRGAVSREVAIAMAEGALAHSRAKLAVSITGFAGPTKDGEEGLVHFACLRDGREVVHREEHFGAIGRDGVRLAALEVGLEMMKEALDR